MLFSAEERVGHISRRYVLAAAAFSFAGGTAWIIGSMRIIVWIRRGWIVDRLTSAAQPIEWPSPNIGSVIRVWKWFIIDRRSREWSNQFAMVFVRALCIWWAF